MPTTTGKIYLGSTLVAGGAGGAGGWARPADWPSLPSVAATDQVFYGLHAVFGHESNFATIRCTGAFTVDWGDGSAPVNVASNTTAQYNYSYAAAGLGPVTSKGYKTAIVTVTPQAGQTLSVIDLSVKHTQSGLQNQHSSQWLDIRLAMNNAGTVTTSAILTWVHRLIEQFEWVGGSTTQTGYTNFLHSSSSLQSVPLFNTAAGTSFNGFLQNCQSLQSVPLFNTAAGTNFSGFLQNCFVLKSVPLFNTAAGTNFSGFLQGCTSLQSVPLFNTAAGTDFSNFLRGCTALESVPLFSTSAGTNFNFFLTGCAALQSIPLFNTAAGTNFANFLQNCTALQLIPALNFSAGTSFTTFLSGNVSLSRIGGTFPANQNISLASLALGPNALNEIYTNLPTASGSPRTITVTGNWGTAAHDPTIATNKGWTVTA
jgi:hypothetical protein